MIKRKLITIFTVFILTLFVNTTSSLSSSTPSGCGLTIAPVIAGLSPPAGDWPDVIDEELPLGGVFYGNYMTGVGLQNAGIGIETSRRFRAERTGMIAHTSYNNRTLNMRNIIERCERLGPGSIWCNCVDNNLDQYTCGYTIGSAYSVGNGGTIHVELRTNTANGTPSNVTLGRTNSYVPMDNFRDGWPKLYFTTPVQVQAGTIYHLVYVNSNPPTTCTALASIAPSEAGACPRNQGAQGLNGPRYYSNPWRTQTPSTTAARGPYFGDDSAAVFYRRRQESGWRFYEDNISWYEVVYTDGVRTGDVYFSIYVTRYRNVVGGNRRVRQKFTVQDATRMVDGFWLNYGHLEAADGSPLQADLKDASGTVLATGSVYPSAQCLNIIRTDALQLASWCLDWGYTSFGQTIPLVEGATYSVELSGGANAGFLFAAQGIATSWGLAGNRNIWTQAGAEFSTNNGSSWSTWGGVSGGPNAERDLSLLFTIEGMPKHIK